MLTKAQRFADPRKDRANGLPLARLPKGAAKRKQISKLFSKHWVAVRKDKRFAMLELAAAMKKANFGWRVCFTAERVKPMHAQEWARHDAIPDDAFMLSGAHPAQSDPSKIACYPTIADAKRGREVVMAPGRFFAAAFPGATPSEVQKMAESYAASFAPATVHYATDSDDWVRVYESARGFSSCMAGEWEGTDYKNPVRFYAHPDNDLALAYLTHNGKPDGETVARSIVNTRKKKFVRIYGDARLQELLERDGYAHGSSAALNGQKCNAVASHGQLVAPYLDAISRAEWDGCSDYCIISEEGNWDCTNTDGTANEEPRNTCDECGDSMGDDETNYSDYHELTICDHCRERHFTYAIISTRGHESLVRDDETVTIGNRTFVNDCDVLSHYGFVTDSDGEWQDADNCIFLEATGEYELVENCTRLDVPNGEDDYALDCDTKTIILDGEELTVHCDYDGPTDEKIRAEKSKRARISALRIRARQLKKRKAA